MKRQKPEHNYHKEAARIVKAITTGGAPTFSSAVEVDSWELFKTVTLQVSGHCFTAAQFASSFTLPGGVSGTVSSISDPVAPVVLLGCVLGTALHLSAIIPLKPTEPRYIEAQQRLLSESILNAKADATVTVISNNAFISDTFTSDSFTSNACTSDGFPDSDWPKNDVQFITLTYPETSEHSPFKTIDQVFGGASAFLKRVGIYREEEEEYEYTFDDL